MEVPEIMAAFWTLCMRVGWGKEEKEHKTKRNENKNKNKNTPYHNGLMSKGHRSWAPDGQTI